MPDQPNILAFEFMYQPPPTDPRAWHVFGWTLHRRLVALPPSDQVLFLCDSEDTAAETPQGHRAIVINPLPVAPPESPLDWGGEWQRMTMTDRWSRILAALERGREQGTDGYLLMPAHDAVYTRDLLFKLIVFSRQHTQNGVPAAVSPFTFHQHSQPLGVNISQNNVDIVNAAFSRDPAFRLQIESGEAQGFWGKMGLIPFEMCGALLETVDTGVWEDDLEIDRAINTLGNAARTLWIDDPREYRHVLPVFDEAGVRRVIERHLHYSLRTGGSHLMQSLTGMGRYQRVIDPRFGAAGVWADRIIQEEYASMMRRVDHYGASWVDWGAYRYVARPYDPHVEVWKFVLTKV